MSTEDWLNRHVVKGENDDTSMNLYIERIATLKARNTALEAEVERLKKANQHWHDRQPERDTQLELVARVKGLETSLNRHKDNVCKGRMEELEGELAAANHTARIWRERYEDAVEKHKQ